MKNQSVSDFVAAQMDAVLNSKEHKSLFETQYKTASKCCAKCGKADGCSCMDSSMADDENDARKKKDSSSSSSDSSSASDMNDENDARKKKKEDSSSDSSSADDAADDENYGIVCCFRCCYR